MSKKYKLHKCKNPNCENLTTNKKYCSLSCNSSIIGKLYGKIGGKNAAKTNKQNKTGFQGLTHIQCVENGRRAAKVNKINKTGVCHDPKLQSEMGKKGGLASQKTLRHNIRNLLYKGQYYDSPNEIEKSICLQEQYKYIPKEDINLHIQIGKFEYDYLIEELKIFVEPHQWFKNETEQEYFDRKRKNLDDNGYENYKLIVINN